MRLIPIEITDKIRVWEISDANDVFYILMKNGELTFLKEIDEYGEIVPPRDEVKET